jgi:predicted DNA-binding transcriptional regulator AlpA
MKQHSDRIYENMLSTAEVASILGVSTRTIFRMLASGKILAPARDPHSGYFVWRPEEVEQILQDRLRKKHA